MVLLLCTAHGSPGYRGMAQKLDRSLRDIKSAGEDLRLRGFATVSHTRIGREFAGSVLHLTPLGVEFKEYVASRKWGV